ncbi:hypothetical protein [Blastococcus capsensis]|uniref:hypothetical protein n=1 Tax=Blastococcus capsensis TaxID=1564163 RepID=UPI00253FD5E3|nr:hypothetical protein [Blastococcus capsensis]MDK3257432.1 hypothetical protein [Blastococcus capsensis]
MSQPTTPGPGASSTPHGETVPSWPAPGTAWPAPGAQPAPDWATTAPSWQPAAPAAAPGAATPAASSGRTRWAVAGAALAGVAAGAVAATFLVSAVFIGSAEGIGRAMGEEMAAGITEGVREGMVEGSQESMDAMLGGLLGEEGMGSWYGGMPGGSVEQFPPVEPADLGPDETLDAYAQGCFEGDLQSCDDLMYESPPLSDYEEYGSSCGGRVKPFTVMACTELE